MLTAQLTLECLVRSGWDVSVDNIVIGLKWGAWIKGLQIPISLWPKLPLTRCQKSHVPGTRAEVLFGPWMPHARWRKQASLWHCILSVVPVCSGAQEHKGAQPPANWGLPFSCPGQACPTCDVHALRVPETLCGIPRCFIELNYGFCIYCLGCGRIFNSRSTCT